LPRASASIVVLDRGSFSEALAISPRGIPVGRRLGGDDRVSQGGRAAWWPTPGSPRAIATPSAVEAVAFGINERGVIVGRAFDTTVLSQVLPGGSQPFRWAPGVGIVYLPLPRGDLIGEARGINERGEVVGGAIEDAGIPVPGHAVRWDPLGRARVLPGGVFANAINNAGRIVGEGPGAVYWDNGRVHRLPDLRGGESSATALNQVGTMVGWSRAPSGVIHAVLWTPRGALRDLGVPPGAVEARATGIDNAEEVVGTYFDENGLSRAFVWTQRKRWQDLPVPSRSLQSFASGINHAGQIAGGVIDEAFTTGAVVWNLARSSGTHVAEHGSDGSGR
jgi:uncharacterized membrane protein